MYSCTTILRLYYIIAWYECFAVQCQFGKTKSQQFEHNDTGTVAVGIRMYSGHPLPVLYAATPAALSSTTNMVLVLQMTVSNLVQLDFAFLLFALANCFEVTMKINSFIASLGFFGGLPWELR